MIETTQTKNWMKDQQEDPFKTVDELPENEKVNLNVLVEAGKITRGEIPPPPGSETLIRGIYGRKTVSYAAGIKPWPPRNDFITTSHEIA